MTTTEPQVAARLPEIRGPLSAAVVDTLAGGRTNDFDLDETRSADPFGEDLQLALHVCYELHYQGFAGVDPGWEWDPGLLRFRAALERVFLDGIRAAVPGGDDVDGLLDELLVEPADGTGVSHFLRDEGAWWQMEEYFAQRSIYHLKEADPHAWVIPRLRGKAKAALVAVEFDEFGGGRADQAHSRLFADLLTAAGLSPGYLAYLDHVPGCTLATVNMMSLFGLHRSLRGALVGHFACAEITTAPAARRMDEALRRLGGAAECRYFYTEHIEADAVHEQVLRHDVIGDLLAREPDLAADVALGIQATELLETRLADHLLKAWSAGESSLLRPLHPLP
ncbi:iron-containing redox enzyme family protein [Amycolatopsis orientalis]|uniref:iron-containing redox enzyme family protein n=1 Tax=Amycolatopsis orientalis TaxID=31958 RepID=UPI00040B2A76|nr:iron-containing redox enzyme family protein [Amycolatopsis orientalis]